MFPGGEQDVIQLVEHNAYWGAVVSEQRRVDEIESDEAVNEEETQDIR